MGGGQALKRIPRIKFPQRRPKPSSSSSSVVRGSEPVHNRLLLFNRWKKLGSINMKKYLNGPADTSSQSTDDALKAFLSKSASGKSSLSASGKASDQPKRAPMSNDEIEAIMLGGSF